MKKWEEIFKQRLLQEPLGDDPAHDYLHFLRVVKTAKFLCRQERCNINVVLPAAWFHDLVNVPKNSPLRNKASQMSAEKALEFLKSVNYPEKYFDDIRHAIEAHSFSANITATTLEAKIVQDADRLDGLGAIGIARGFATAGILKRPFYEIVDPFCKRRKPDDMKYTVDHFYQKLFQTAYTLKTKSGKAEGRKRTQLMKIYLKQLGYEIK
jgi:uncharacterized protein